MSSTSTTKTHDLKDFVIESGIINADVFREVEKKARSEKKPVDEVLLAEGTLSEDNLRRVRAWQLGVPFVDLGTEKIDPEILKLIPEPVAKSHNVVAYRKNKNGLEVAMLDTGDLPALDFIKKKVELKILPRLTSAESIKHALNQYRKSLQGEFDDLIKEETANLTMVTEKEHEDSSPEDLKKLAEDLPVIKIVDTLISHAILGEASDIHIEPHEHELVVRYRIDGILRDAMVLPISAASGITARVKVLASLKLDEKRLPQDGRFKLMSGDEEVSFRVSVLPTQYGEKTVMRILRESAAGFTLEGLGFHGEGLEQIHAALKHQTGMILATGPTGSGKSTTLYTMLDILNTKDVNISTVEDPIEYHMDRVNQTQVRADIGLTFASGLRSLLRQDPDIIMVGEIRDTETASLAINAALTGHLVLSTLHTNSAAGAIPRLVDMGVEPFLIVSTLDVILGQRLVRRLADSKEPHTLSDAEYQSLSETVDLDRVLENLKKENVVKTSDTWKTVQFYKPVPSEEYADGYHGRVGIHEVLAVTPAIRDMIMKNATSDAIEEVARKEGMITMLEDGVVQAVRGYTTIAEILRVISE
jgi:type IV pilus assembly protein PilB